MTSWFLFLPSFRLVVSPSWQWGKSGQGERRAWPRNCSQAPAPAQVGLLPGTLLSLSLVLQEKERDVEMHSCLLSNPPFFFRRHHGLIFCVWTLAWPVQKNSPQGISHFWFCFCFGLDIPLCPEVSLYLFLLHFYTTFIVTFHTVHVSALLAPNTMTKSPAFLFDQDTPGSSWINDVVSCIKK